MIRCIFVAFGQLRVWELVLLITTATLAVAIIGVLSHRMGKLNPLKADKVITAFVTIYWVMILAMVMGRLLYGIFSSPEVVSAIEQQRDRGIKVILELVITDAAVLLYYPILLWVGRAGYFCCAYIDKKRKHFQD